MPVHIMQSKALRQQFVNGNMSEQGESFTLQCIKVIFVDNTPSHPTKEELHNGGIKALFLPANVPSLC